MSSVVLLAVLVGSLSPPLLYGGFIIAYLLIGVVWSILLFMEFSPLHNRKEIVTFWTINIFLWSIIIGIVIYRNIIRK
jgi:hypothetical protein